MNTRASRCAIWRLHAPPSRYERIQPQAKERTAKLPPNRVTFLNGPNRDFPKYRRQDRTGLSGEIGGPRRARRRPSAPATDLVDPAQQIGRIVVDAERTGLPQLLRPVTAAQKTDAQRAASHRGQHVPDAVADDARRFDRRVEPLGGRQKQVRVRFCIFDLIARHHGNPIRIDAERGQIDGCGFHAAAGRDRPGNAGLRQPAEQFAGAGQGPDLSGLLPVRGGMGLAKPVDALGADLDPGLAKQLVGEQAAHHAYLAMDAPDRQFDTLGVEGMLPGQDVLVDAVDERAVKIKQEGRLDAHVGALALYASRHLSPAASNRLTDVESLELRVPEIERLVVAGLLVRGPERL